MLFHLFRGLKPTAMFNPRYARWNQASGLNFNGFEQTIYMQSVSLLKAVVGKKIDPDLFFCETEGGVE